MFVFPSDPASGAAFFERAWSGAEAIADPDKRLYDGFGLERGTLGQFVGPRVIAAGLRAFRKGHGVGLPKGDPLVLSGTFLVDDGVVTWARPAAHAGDHPASDELEQAVADSASAREHEPCVLC